MYMYNAGDPGSIPGSGRSRGEGNGNPLQYSCLENSWTEGPGGLQSMEFFRQEYWSGLPFPSPGDLPDPGIEPGSPALHADSLPSEPQGSPDFPQVGKSYFKYPLFCISDVVRFDGNSWPAPQALLSNSQCRKQSYFCISRLPFANPVLCVILPLFSYC